MKRAVLSFVTALALTCGAAGAASAGGVTICNGTRMTVGFALGYAGANGLESTGPFESGPGTCATVLAQVAKGPFHVYGGEARGMLSWTRGGEGSQAFCWSNAAHFVIRNIEHMKDGKLTCPERLGQFMPVPDDANGTPKFTFTEDNSDR